MLRGTASPRPPARETDVDEGLGESGTMTEYREPTMTFEPYEPTTPLKSPTRLTPSGGNSSNPLLSNLQHQRQYSAPDLSLSPADTLSRSRSPPKRGGHVRHQSQGMPLTGDTRAGRRPDNSPGRFGGWLSSTPTSTDVSPDTTPKSKRSVTAVETTPKNTTPSRFGFFASSMSALTTRLTNQTTPLASPRDVDDELCNMDVEAALYPAQSPSERDTFSPAAYKNLQANAAGLLRRMQDAYRQRTVVLREVQAEREAQREEMEETELRTRNFKSQLESMAAKAAEQELAMQRLVAELHAEKKARQEEQQQQRRMYRDKPQFADGESPMITEDLCVDEDEEDQRRRWRKSDGTVRSDLSIDTDAESAESESIFSRSRSPTATAMTSATDGEIPGVRTPPTLNVPLKPRSTPQHQQQLTTFQKLVKGISGEDGCSNCRGQDSSVAWDTVSLLRDENRSLKHRVAQLEVVVEGALDVVNGIGLP
ncbi:hypothetical protein F4821DRAFT_224005 [Hypoxylon rubiginosum]|uniref:Uncharacterized protein n=1 Tax=Hypoxylon rubiginosum TaxID=110542 RepID=A0ACC0DI55_9PEZI|nr:hypothetical protein F4821DRAFT_224005 [Hypoxylon rubiginosum]